MHTQACFPANVSLFCVSRSHRQHSSPPDSLVSSSRRLWEAGLQEPSPPSAPFLSPSPVAASPRASTPVCEPSFSLLSRGCCPLFPPHPLLAFCCSLAAFYSTATVKTARCARTAPHDSVCARVSLQADTQHPSIPYPPFCGPCFFRPTRHQRWRYILFFLVPPCLAHMPHGRSTRGHPALDCVFVGTEADAERW